jgi:hypothetical protein
MACTQITISDINNGTRYFRDVLEDEYHLDLAGWNLFGAVGISADGTKIAFNTPESATALLLAPGSLAVLRRKRR